MSVSCPVCGSNNVSPETETETINVVYGKPTHIVNSLHKCNDCGEVGNFLNQGKSQENKNIIDQAKKDSVANMINFLSSCSISMAYFERSLELPQRTLIRWKNDGCSAPSLALLRIIRTYPWILKVADANFNSVYAQRELVNQAADIFLSSKNVSTAFSVQNQNTIIISAKIERQDQNSSIGSGTNLFLSEAQA